MVATIKVYIMRTSKSKFQTLRKDSKHTAWGLLSRQLNALWLCRLWYSFFLFMEQKKTKKRIFLPNTRASLFVWKLTVPQRTSYRYLLKVQEFHLSAAPQDDLPCLGHTAHPEMKGGTLGYNTASSEMLPTLINDPAHIPTSPVKESPAPLNSTGFFWGFVLNE